MPPSPCAPARLAPPGRGLRLPLYAARVPAGRPVNTGSDLDAIVDLGELVGASGTTYLVRVEGDSMLGAGIEDGDTLVVERAAEPRDGHVVIAALEGELTVKRVRRRGRRLFLVPSNEDFDPIEVPPGADFQVWGVVTFVLRDLRRSAPW